MAVDQGGDTVRLPQPAARVIALIPSVNELLLAMGAGPRIVARTNYDVDPALSRLPSIGGGLDPSLEALLALRPDLVIAWGGRAHDALRQRLERAGIATFGIGTQDTTEIFRSIAALGVLTGHEREADSLHAEISAELAEVARSVAGLPSPTVLYALSIDPPMTAGPNTYVSELIGVAGGRNVFHDLANDFPGVALEEIVRRDPDVLLLPSGEAGDAPHITRLQQTPGWRELRAVRDGRVIVIPALLLDRPGAHMGQVARAIRDGLHPGAGTPNGTAPDDARGSPRDSAGFVPAGRRE